MEDQITFFKSKKDLPLSVQKKKEEGWHCKNLCFGEGVRERNGFVQLQVSIPFYKTALRLDELKDLQYTPKKNYSYSALTLQLPGGFLTVMSLKNLSLNMPRCM